MGVDEVPVDPGIGLGRQLIDHQFPGRQHDLPVLVSDEISVHVHVVEIVVEPDGLDLLVGLQQGALVPDADVLDRGIVLFQVLSVQGVPDLEIDLLDFVQIIGLAVKSMLWAI